MRLFTIPHTLYPIPLLLLLLFAAALPALADGTININNPSAGTGWTFADNVVTITANGNYTVTGSSTTNRIVINKDITATITLQNATIHSAVASPFALSSDDTGGSRVILILEGTNELVTTAEWPESPAALTVENNATIIIEGNGSLTASGGEFAAGIGGGIYSSGGNITVTGGTITATGGEQAAGIGGGMEGAGGNITVTGGTITATGGDGGAGIGGGAYGAGGNITVTGGTIIATGGSSAAGIGGGAYGAGGNITVTGGTVTATGGGYAAGIGGGYEGDGGNISISNGIIISVTSGGTGDPAGIGGGGSAGAGTVTVTGGTVYASGGTGPGIGGGTGATGGMINITGGTVIADKIGIGHGGTTATNISGANTLVLSQSINTTTYGGATVLTGTNVNVSGTITTGDNVADVTLNAALTIPSGATLVVPTGIVFDVNSKALTNSGIIREYGSLLNKGSLTGNQPVGAIQASWISIPSQTYTGDSIKPTITVTNGTLTLAHGAHYTITAYANNVNAGTATVTLTDLGDYSIVSKTFTIAPKALAAGWITDIPPQTYTGNPLTPAVTVRDGSKTLTLNTDYTVAYTNNVNAGTATVTVTGKGNYTGSASKTFLIEDTTPPSPVQITAGWIDSIPPQTYTGNPLTPAVTVRDGSKTLTLNTDYTVAYTNNVNAGTATVTVTGMGNYTGSASRTFLIVKQIAASWIADIPPQTYTGNPLTPAVVVMDGSKTLTLNTDYTVAYTNNVNAGTATVTVTGKGNYTGSASKTFLIEDTTPPSSVQITAGWIDSIPPQTYTGNPLTPAVTVRDGSKTLTLNTDYTVTYTNNINVGTATATVTGMGNYTGSASRTFLIVKQIAASWIADIPPQTYTGNPLTPAVVVMDGSKTLTLNTDYTVAYTNNVNAGTATATVTGKGNYTGSASRTFLIVKQIAASWIADIPPQTYTGDSVKPAVTVRDGNYTLVAGTDYTVSYTNNVNIGTATATVTGMGNYTGSASRTFLIVKQIAASWIDSIPAQTYTGDSVKPAVTVRDGDYTLVAGTDYTVSYTDNVNIGTATATVTGKGNYTGSASVTFTIKTKALAAGWIESIPAQPWTGDSLKPAIVVRDGSTTLTLNTDYTVAYTNNVNIGTATATVTGKGNYTGSASVTFTIKPKALAAGWMEALPAQTYPYTGDSIKPAVVVRDDSNPLTLNTDYTVAYTNNVNAGTATVTVTGMGYYAGTIVKSFAISPKALAAGSIQEIPAQAWTGDSVIPAVTVRTGGKTLTPGVDYTITYSNIVQAGLGMVTITGKGNYSGSAVGFFDILPREIAVEWIEDVPPQTWTGKAIEPPVTVRDLDGTLLIAGTDYRVTYANNVNVGPEAWVAVTGMGNYAGTKSKMFSIVSQPTDTVPADTVPTPPPPADTVSKAVTGVSFYNDSYIVEKGKTLQLFVAIEPADAGNRNVSWATSNRAVATISAGGRVTAVSAGEATITVTTAAGGYRDTCLIRVPGIVTTKDTVIYQKTIFYERDTLYRDTTVYRTDTLYTDTVHRVDTLYRDTTLYRTDTLYRDTTVCRTDTLYNNIVINVVDTVQVDSINYTLVPDTVYVVTDITGAEHAVTAAAPVVRVGTVLRIESLTPGKTFGIYRVTGEKLYSGTAQSDVFRLDNIPAGVYILYHAGQYSKFSY
ncbi:MAG: Ig-like domain-containing protein [Bacteroidales bacterium]